jgi:hypothetical protein
LKIEAEEKAKRERKLKQKRDRIIMEYEEDQKNKRRYPADLRKAKMHKVCKLLIKIFNVECIISILAGTRLDAASRDRKN